MDEDAHDTITTMNPSSAIHSHRSPLVLSHLAARRRKAGQAYAEGERTVGMALDGDWPCLVLFVAEDFADDDRAGVLLEKARSRKCRVVRATRRALEKLSDCDTAPPVGVIVEAPTQTLNGMTRLPDRLLILDRIKDPGNVGTLVRTAAAFGFTSILTDGSVNPVNEKMIRSSAGMCFLRNALLGGGAVEELSQALRERGTVAYGFDPQAPFTLSEVSVDKSKPTAIVLGSEVAGLDKAVWDWAEQVRIPIKSGVESLNVAMCGGIALYEFAGKLAR